MDTTNAVIALAALAQASRLAVFRHLVELGPEGANPTELVQVLDIPANTLSFHLKTLCQAGLIDAEQNGRFIRYRANFAEMQSLIDFLSKNCCGGDPTKCVPASHPRVRKVTASKSTRSK
ncbi:MAG: helix-turn-helix transcriptional regulator [Xanthomonadales bacterium]|nr:helix-turn-helix transcriptional regulator [Xanthomonadales bacterium]